MAHESYKLPKNVNSGKEVAIGGKLEWEINSSTKVALEHMSSFNKAIIS
jgi:hypothetical protein